MVNSLYQFITDLKELLKKGYEQNPTVFGAANKLASKAANVKLIPMKGDKPSDRDPLKELFNDNKTDYSLKEYRRHFHLSRYITGEAINYTPKYSSGGNSDGEPMFIELMPSQDITIKGGSAQEPVKWYIIKDDTNHPIPAEDVYHSRLFLNLDFDDGKAFRGLAPISVASNIIRAMNAGDKTVAELLEAGSPPYALINEDLDSDQVEEQKELLEKAYREKSKDIPLLAGGKIRKIDLGFNTLSDLQITETDSRGLKIMCNIWGVHVSLFSDEHATENNIGTARKLMYEDRIIPDVEDEIEMYNTLFEGTGIHYEADYSEVQALQEDKEKIAKIYGIGIDKKAVSKNEFREAIGLEPIDDPIMGEEGLIEDAMFVPPVLGFDDEDKKPKKEDE